MVQFNTLILFCFTAVQLTDHQHFLKVKHIGYNLLSVVSRSEYACVRKRCRIAIISDHSDPALEELGTEGAGGQNVYVRQFGEHLSQLGWNVDMFTRQWRKQKRIVRHNPNCRTIRLRAGPVENIHRDILLPYMDEFLKSFLHFQGQNNVTYDVIHTNYWLSGVVGVKVKHISPSIPLVHVFHSLGKVKDNWLQGQRSSRTNISVHAGTNERIEAEQKILDEADLIIATSPHEAQDFERHYSTSKFRKNVVVVPAGVNLDHFGVTGSRDTKIQARENLSLNPNSKLVLYVGRFDRRKGIDVLVEAISQSAFRDDPNFQLVIAGGTTEGMADEVEFKQIRRLVHQRDMQHFTQFPGRLTLGQHNQSLQNWYAAADVLVVPSQYEPFGLVAIEGMSMGVPVVASRIGGLQSTVLHNETGFLVDRGDFTGFSNRIDQILKNPGLGAMLGKAGRNRVEKHFSWKIVTEEIDRQLKKLILRRLTKPNDCAIHFCQA